MATAKPSLKALFPQLAPDIGKERRVEEARKARDNEARKAREKAKETSAQKNSSEDPKKKKEAKPAEPRDAEVRQDIVPPERHKGSRGGGDGGGAEKQPTANGYSKEKSKSRSLQVPADDRVSGKGKQLAAGNGLPDRVSMTAPDRQLKPEALVIRKSRSTNCLKSIPEHLDSLRGLDSSPVPVNVVKLHAAMKAEYKSGKHFETFPRNNGTVSDQLTPTGGSSECLLLDGSSTGGMEVRERWRVERTGSAMGQIRSIRGMCFTRSGDLAIAEPENARVQVFSSADGKPHRVLTAESSGRRMHPAGLCSVPGRSILAAADLNRFVFLDPGFRDGWSTVVSVADKTRLTGIGCTLRGDLILTDTGVRPSAGLYEADGKIIREFKAVDWKKPKAVTVSYELGITFVSDSEAGSVFMFDQDGRLLNRLGRSGNDDTRLVYPHGLCCAARGTQLLVADRANLGVLVYDLRNRAVDRLVGVTEGAYGPACLASWRDRYLAVSSEIHDLKVDDYKLKLFRTKM